MHLKRLLIIFVGLGFILTFNTSCENDRDYSEPNTTLEPKDLANTYTGKKLIINAKEAIEKVAVEVIINENNEGIFKIKNLVTDYPDISFTVPIAKKENGAYQFEHSGYFVTEESGMTYSFDGTFVGTTDTGTTIIAQYVETPHMKEDDIFAYKNPLGSLGQYFQERLIINGIPALSTISTSSQAVRFTKSATTGVKDVAIGNVLFNVGTVTLKDIQIVRNLDKPNSFTFIHYSEDEPGIVNETNFRKVTITRGVIENGVVYVDAEVVAKSSYEGTEWQIDPTDKQNFVVSLTSKDAAEKLKDGDRVKFLQDHSDVVIPILLRMHSVKFYENATADISYITNTDGVVKLETKGAFNFTSATLMTLGVSEIGIDDIATRSQGLVTATDVFNMFHAGNGQYKCFSLAWTKTATENIKTWSITAFGIRSAASFAAISMPTTVEGMKKMGLTISQADIDTLKNIFIHMSDTSTLSNGKITFGLKKIN